MSADLHNLIIQGHPKGASSPSAATHPHNDPNAKAVGTAASQVNQSSSSNHTLGPAAQLEISPEAQAMVGHNAPVPESSRSNQKTKTPSEAKTLLQTIQKQLTENPDLAKSVHSNVDALRIIQKIY